MTRHKLRYLLGLPSVLIAIAMTTPTRAQLGSPKPPKQTDSSKSAPTTDAGCHDDEKKNEGLPPPNPDEPQPQFRCDQPQVIAGHLWQGNAARFSFTIRNDGNGDLILLIGRT